MIESYKSKMKIITETYDVYKNKIEPYINSILESNTKWMKNILNLQNEANKILFKGEKFIVVKNIGYDTKNDFYLLAIPYESLKNIRDLEPKHKELLKLMKLKTLEIAKKHNFDEEDLYFFFHYHPSCYHLHLHICLNTHKNLKFKIYRHVLLDDVMENIEKIGKKLMKFEINISNPIYKLLIL
jgi:m7GpppX diphosphatase